jgi:hypothetical protein
VDRLALRAPESDDLGGEHRPGLSPHCVLVTLSLPRLALWCNCPGGYGWVMPARDWVAILRLAERFGWQAPPGLARTPQAIEDAWDEFDGQDPYDGPPACSLDGAALTTLITALTRAHHHFFGEGQEIQHVGPRAFGYDLDFRSVFP